MQPKKPRLLPFLVILGLLSSSCSTMRKPASDPAPYLLPGFNETLLVGGGGGELAVLKIGDAWTRKDIPTSLGTPPDIVRRHQGRFHLLYENGTFLTLDPEEGTLVRKSDLGITHPADFAFSGDSFLYVSLKQEGSVVKIDLNSGEKLASIDLKSLRNGNGRVEPHRMLLIGNRLFVQVARTTPAMKKEQGALAVIDTASNQLQKVIELQVQGPPVQPGLDPDLPLAFDRKRNKLFVSLVGNRPSDTGMIIRIDPGTLEIHDFKKAQAGFQGAVAIQQPFSKLYIIYHTSTPTISSHLFFDLVSEDGQLSDGTRRALVNSFDGTNSLVINDAGTLVAMANTCVSGFCIGGAGVNFIDAANDTILPKLMASVLGFEPVFVEFR